MNRKRERKFSFFALLNSQILNSHMSINFMNFPLIFFPKRNVLIKKWKKGLNLTYLQLKISTKKKYSFPLFPRIKIIAGDYRILNRADHKPWARPLKRSIFFILICSFIHPSIIPVWCESINNNDNLIIRHDLIIYQFAHWLVIELIYSAFHFKQKMIISVKEYQKNEFSIVHGRMYRDRDLDHLQIPYDDLCC